MTTTKWINALLIVAVFCFQSCAVIGGIFKAGVWVGVIAVILVILLIVFLVSRGSGKR